MRQRANEIAREKEEKEMIVIVESKGGKRDYFPLILRL